MKSLILAVWSLVVFTGTCLAQEHGGKVEWIRDPEGGFLKAQVEQRVLMLYFTATW